MYNLPVYNFLGFNLLRCSFNRNNGNDIESFGIKITNSHFDEINHVHQLGISINLNYGDQNISYFDFSSGYKINNMEWYNSLTINQINQTLFAIVFPFIRNMVANITDDSRGRLILPIIDLKNIDLNLGATFTMSYKNAN